MAQPIRPYSIVLGRVAAVNIAALLLFLGSEVILLFVAAPSKAVLAFAGPICHYGIIVSLFTAVVLVVVRWGFAVAGRDGAK